MNLETYPKHALVTLCGVLLFFLGFVAMNATPLVYVSLFIVMLLTVIFSYNSRDPVGGLIIGVFTTSVFLFGYLSYECVQVSMNPLPGQSRYPARWILEADPLKRIFPDKPETWVFLLLKNVLSFGDYGRLPSILSAIFAFASLGFFFGTIGYVFEKIPISPRVSETHPLAFRDYWSQVHGWGKSFKREYDDLDRRLSGWSIRSHGRGWFGSIVKKLTEPKPDLVFDPHPEKNGSGEFRVGDLFELSSGQRIKESLVDYSDLISRYRPKILKVAEISLRSSSLRTLALEGLMERFLNWFIQSPFLWIAYISLSAALCLSVYIFYYFHLVPFFYYKSFIRMTALFAAGISSFVTLCLVFRWNRASKELFKRRPDERVLIFSVYTILALIYVFYFLLIINPPLIAYPDRSDLILEPDPSLSDWLVIPKSWVGSWLIWTVSFLFLAFLLGFGYVCVHREAETFHTYFYDNSSNTSGVPRVSPFRNSEEEPPWLVEDKTEAFWVLRFMYYWPLELTTIPHDDWERVEVWMDAEKGDVKWIVSDYHYRELWYKIEGKLPILYIKFFMNFHTPIPVVDSHKIDVISRVFSLEEGEEREKIPLGALIKVAITGRADPKVQRAVKTVSMVWKEPHRADWIRKYEMDKFSSEFCSKLPWTYWRYPFGVEKSINSKRAEWYKQNPATSWQDQPRCAEKT